MLNKNATDCLFLTN